MGEPPAFSSSHAEPVSRLLETTLQRLQPLCSTSARGDGIIYCGNRHESVPRALFLDPRLTPLERNAWQVFRLLLNEDGVTAFPTYAQLGPYLASLPLGERASDETIARALTLLRLTRWLSLVRHRRDQATGRMQGNLYVLHDEPLSPYEAIQLDPHYLSLVSHALTHAAKSVQRMGHHTLQEVTQDPLLAGRILPSRLQLLIQRLAGQTTQPASTNSSEHNDISHVDRSRQAPTRTTRELPLPGANGMAKSTDTPPSESKARPNTTPDPLRIPKTARTVRTNPVNNKIRTVLAPHVPAKLKLPESFGRLPSEQQAGALAALAQVDPTVQQLVLDEWAVRCHSTTVRNPAGYLFGIIQKALRGDFHAWAGQRAQELLGDVSSADTTSPERTSKHTRSEIAEQHIATIRAMFRLP
jgi:hypothetical protein